MHSCLIDTCNDKLGDIMSLPIFLLSLRSDLSVSFSTILETTTNVYKQQVMTAFPSTGLPAMITIISLVVGIVVDQYVARVDGDLFL